MTRFVKRFAEDDVEQIVILGVFQYLRIGLISVISVCGLPIYKRIDHVKSLLGIVWGRRAA